LLLARHHEPTRNELQSSSPHTARDGEAEIVLEVVGAVNGSVLGEGAAEDVAAVEGVVDGSVA
jgi:hypothetical protein